MKTEPRSKVCLPLLLLKLPLPPWLLDLLLDLLLLAASAAAARKMSLMYALEFLMKSCRF